MPYFVTTKTFDVKYPSVCPYCSVGVANAKYMQRFAKTDLGRIPGTFSEKSWKISLPACEACANVLRRSRLGYLIAGVAVFIIPIGLIATFILLAAITREPSGLPSLIAVFGALDGGMIILWATLLLFHRAKRRAFRVAYIGPDEVVYSSTRSKYAQEFAELNDTGAEEKSVLFKFT